ncbi:hypothetical protein Glove_300g71 [Diversispora epigaea]|uniref:Uncharacterized protein n=1 Tax=Diversispora epigaea TaxID=1348612 RepID=A0A397I019_9GLOM|nr:hypothetical protein Glove_300g71 [Diversispora epigaea]
MIMIVVLEGDNDNESDDLVDPNLRIPTGLSLSFDQLEILKEMIEKLNIEFDQKAIKEFIAQLVDLWNKCLISQYECDEFFECLQKTFYLLLESADEIYELLSQEVVNFGKTNLNRGIPSMSPLSKFIPAIGRRKIEKILLA